MNRTELRELARHVHQANAALVALTSGHCHDGRPLPGRERTLATAIKSIREAGALIATSATESDANPCLLS